MVRKTALLAVVLALTMVGSAVTIAAVAQDQQEAGNQTDDAVDAQSQSHLRVAHAAQNSEAVDVSVDNETVASNVQLGEVGNYVNVSSGEVNVTVTPAANETDGAGDAEPVIEETVTVDSRSVTTLVIYEPADALDADDPELMTYEDDARTPSGDESAVRAVNLASDGQDVNVTVTSGDGMADGVGDDAGADDATGADAGEDNATGADAGEDDATGADDNATDAGGVEDNATDADAGEDNATDADVGDENATDADAGEDNATGAEDNATDADTGEDNATDADGVDDNATDADDDATGADTNETGADAGEDNATGADAGEDNATGADAGEDNATDAATDGGAATTPGAQSQTVILASSLSFNASSDYVTVPAGDEATIEVGDDTVANDPTITTTDTSLEGESAYTVWILPAEDDGDDAQAQAVVTPDATFTLELPENVSDQGEPDDAGETETPAGENETETPEEEGETETPAEEDETETPEDEGEAETPEEADETETPEDEGDDAGTTEAE